MAVVLPHGRALGDELVNELVRTGARAEVAGTIRRAHELVDEIVLVCDRAPSEVAVALQAPDLSLSRVDGGVAGTLELEEVGIPVRVRCTSARGFVEGLLRESGSDAHVAALEARALARGTSLGEIAAAVEHESAVYEALGLSFVPPELRDDDTLEVPPLIGGIRGAFHVHTTWSDGVLGVAPMARAARERGLSYVGISDHSRAAYYANGLDVDRLMQQRAEVERARREVPDITIFHGIECDILQDGTLDLPDEALAELDFVVASVHSDLDLDRDTQTRRVLRALSHPLVTILGHPTARLLLGRPPLELDLDAVATRAAQTGVCLEINTTALRLNLSADRARRAGSLGASFAISPDAHEPRGFDTLPFGVLLARRARLSDDRVLNSADADALGGYLRRRRELGARALGLA